MQVLHVHGVSSVDKRVKATNSDGYTLSIPLNSSLGVQRLSASDYGELYSVYVNINVLESE